MRVLLETQGLDLAGAATGKNVDGKTSVKLCSNPIV